MMKYFFRLFLILSLTIFFLLPAMAQRYQVDTRIDNMGYWIQMAKLGLVPVAPEVPVTSAEITPSQPVFKNGLRIDDGPDVPIINAVTTTQSENSIFVDPNDIGTAINSNNSTTNPVGTLYGASGFYTINNGQVWTGSVQGTGGSDDGDPSCKIGTNGYYYNGFINSSWGQSVAYSTNAGLNWTSVQVCAAGGAELDKNHLWIDNAPDSPYQGYLYDAWTDFDGANNGEVEFCRSTNNGTSWSTRASISNGVNSLDFNHGVNINSGPNGEVYVTWVVYDGWPQDEKAIGFCKSTNGGASFATATRIINNIKGVRQGITNKNQRTNSFPSMSVDISNGPNRGNIYIVWANRGVPGVNSGNDVTVYMLRSTNGGSSWSSPIKVNQDSLGTGKKHYFPYITCDPVTGTLSVIYYDDRNVTSTQCEVYCSISWDAGDTWTDLKVSDVAFTPTPIPGLASSYMGDYIGIDSRGGMVYPVWTDNRSGHALAYTSPFMTGPPPGQPYIIYVSNIVNDSLGNNNGEADLGETVQLGVSVANIGDTDGENCWIKLRTTSPYISIIDSIKTIGDIRSMDTVFTPNAFKIHVASNAPDGNVAFDLIASNDTITWKSKFNLYVHSPVLGFNGLTFTEVTGNNNGKLDAGETGNINIYIKNNGTDNALNVVGTIASSDPYITINQNQNTYGTIDGGESTVMPYSISTGINSPLGHIAIFSLSMTADGGYTKVDSFAVVIGQIPCVVIDLDPSPNSGTRIQDAILQNLIACDYMTTFPTNINIYSSVFLCLGVYPSTHLLTYSEGQILANYLTSGGRLYMEGGDTWTYNPPTPVHPMFHINGTNDGFSDLSGIVGQPSTFTQGMTFTYSGGNAFIDRLDPVAPAYTIFKNSNPVYNNAIAFDAGIYKTIGSSFEFGGLNNANPPSTRTLLMEKILRFFNVILPITHKIDLTSGWQMISTYIEPNDPNMNSVISGINPHLKIIKNGQGRVYIPQYNINTIGNWGISDGYYINMLQADTLKITGYEIRPEFTAIGLNSGWSLISYIRDNPMPINVALAGISGTLLAAKSSGGGVYVPLYNINTIGNMVPGQGYYVYLNTPAVLYYPANTNGRTAVTGISVTPEPRLETKYKKTGNSSVLIVQLDGVSDGCEVGVFNENDEIVGSGTVKDQQAAITVWGDDESTELTDGAKLGENLTMKLYNKSLDKSEKLRINGIFDLTTKQPVDELQYKPESVLTLNGSTGTNNISGMTLEVNPNPVNGNSTVIYNIPEAGNIELNLYSIQGQLIRNLFTGSASEGQAKLTLESGNLSSGVYNLILRNGTQTKTQRVVIVK